MLRQIGTLEINTYYDWDNKAIKALEDAGLSVILESQYLTTEKYIIAKNSEEEEK